MRRGGHRIWAWLAAALVLVASATLVEATAISAEITPCPPVARYATNGAGLAFCLFEHIALPNTDRIGEYCDSLHEGILGFAWPLVPAAANYVCPSGALRTTDGDALGFCLFDTRSAPAAASPYCSYVADGYIGYSWPIH